MMKRFFLLVLAGFVINFCSGGEAMALELRSPSFENNGVLPADFTCEGRDISPELQWGNVAPNTKSFALICDDPDAPSKVWVHWLLYNIPGEAVRLPEGIALSKMLKDGSRQAHTDSGTDGYSGPCPPPGKPHRYFFKLYALDSKLTINGKVTKEKLLEAMEGHILATAQLMGTYQR